jgi:crotonobetainyl-CoA:carnitine CoA-transferase CaiB-like acyl-CoA transferase
MKFLEGIRVLDLSRFVSGPFCSMMLGDMGAEVLKIERPGGGDNTRKWSPSNTTDPPYFLSVNRNKRSVALDFQKEEGKKLLLKLVESCDVFLHNLRPGTFEQHGYSYEQLRDINPQLIFCEISGYGKEGPDSFRAAFDLTIQAESGLMSLIGEPGGEPMKVGVPVTDIETSLMACIAIQGALVRRERTGKGARVAISMIEAALACMPNVASEYLVDGVKPRRWGSGHPSIVPYQVFPASDGWVTIGIGAEAHWKPFCELIERPDLIEDPCFATNPARLANRELVTAELASIISQKPRRYWREKMAALGLPSAPVNSLDEMLEGPQVRALGTVQTVEHSDRGPIRMLRSPIQADGEYLGIDRPPPILGEHTDEVLKELAGLDDTDLANLRRAGAIG